MQKSICQTLVWEKGQNNSFLLSVIFLSNWLLENKRKNVIDDKKDDYGYVTDLSEEDKEKIKKGIIPRLGLETPSVIVGVGGKADVIVKNTGDVNVAPAVIDKDGKVLFQFPPLEKGKKVKGVMDISKLKKGTYDVKMVGAVKGGSGLALKIKLVVK